ncbi:hypothetical protein K469DRAFT_727252 [Zopfia rhizophila CBS 207.26]|uniref:Protein-lysine N-methyltransferase EFM6 n=1 Tax=Zopfia rhizophila CBS 207.26 TaxID=1314779 RepID=A0A6A6DZX3_9PEZI|nr:hypothetical protein K469DRAFT_727252 [Zopfia rhizophila CBS 207.26]
MSDSENDILNFGADLVPPAVIKSARVSTVDFDGLLSTPLKLREDLTNGCGGQLWPAGMVLSKYMLKKHRNDLDGKEILAVGLGCSPTTLHITDQLPMFDLMKQNILLNNLSDTVQASVYDWGEPVPNHLPRNPDIILAADCVYFEPAFPLLQKTLADLIGERTVCYFCFKKRRRADLNFMKGAKKAFAVKKVDDDPDKGVYERENIFLYRITTKA